MEKFSNWRDPSTGLAPFVYPPPPLSNFRNPAILRSPFYVLAFLRTILLVGLAGNYLILDQALNFMFIVSPGLWKVLRSWMSTVLGRMALYLLGFTRLPADSPFSSFRGIPARTRVGPGDVIVVNWCSYVEIIYLAYLYDPIFIVPSPSPRPQQDHDAIDGFCARSVLNLITTSGHPPFASNESNKTSENTPKTLSEWVVRGKISSQPVVVFPEATTSNNRAVLRFVKLTAKLRGNQRQDIRFFCLGFKHESPTHYRPSIICPIPSPFSNLIHIFRANSCPILFPGISPRTFTVRYPKSGPIVVSSDQKDRDPFGECAEMILNVCKMRQTTKIGWADKAGFLAYVDGRRA
ncbi:hypothetical protein DFH28DRAFT_952826 [Melampsora americana]|nr:hypothetical protein DFH28DRAFT_952826 [Melampsora americana]